MNLKEFFHMLKDENDEIRIYKEKLKIPLSFYEKYRICEFIEIKEKIDGIQYHYYSHDNFFCEHCSPLSRYNWRKIINKSKKSDNYEK